VEIAKPAVQTAAEPLQPSVSRADRKVSLVLSILAVAAVLLVIVFVRFAPVRDMSYGQITEVYQASQESGGRLYRGQCLGNETIKLDKGMVEIQMDEGPVVLVEAPAEIRLEENNQMFLVQGKVTADVPKTAIGFTVRTPSATVVDYGTQFGVMVDRFAATEAHVLKGQVEMRLGSNVRVFEKALRLLADQAGSVSGQTLVTIPAAVNQFAYRIPSAFEAAAMELEPMLYFHFKNNDVRTFCEMTSKPGLAMTLSPGVSVVSGPQLGQDKPGTAMKLDGVSGYTVGNVYPVASLDKGDYTVAGWVRLDTIQSQIIWSNKVVGRIADDGTESGGYYRVLWINEKRQLEHTAYYPENTAPQRKVKPIVSQIALEADTWYFIVITHALQKQKMLYINGRLAAQSPDKQGTRLEKYNELQFGLPFEGLAPGLSGAISEVLFFSRDLSDKEIMNLYRAATQH
ncbi:MAG: FecR domain-containing protein, partial [Sedimentisphaerales bacterium]|nr:FecR domain-containing protein [Sedimentisphaerales bacterium]